MTSRSLHFTRISSRSNSCLIVSPTPLPLSLIASICRRDPPMNMNHPSRSPTFTPSAQRFCCAHPTGWSRCSLEWKRKKGAWSQKLWQKSGGWAMGSTSCIMGWRRRRAGLPTGIGELSSAT
ncbi:hypothetical protein IEO21_10428 [Rhodonia placenta]|uniref:Uncharacterized protein n=1 Tax=Rhodonia placenta TaxID=104341 RepID=A0A8H7TXJ0_9APHY|nr:hypothetical protein IEO21_10428 [Postia placenta]